MESGQEGWREGEWRRREGKEGGMAGGRDGGREEGRERGHGGREGGGLAPPAPCDALPSSPRALPARHGTARSSPGAGECRGWGHREGGMGEHGGDWGHGGHGDTGGPFPCRPWWALGRTALRPSRGSPRWVGKPKSLMPSRRLGGGWGWGSGTGGRL